MKKIIFTLAVLSSLSAFADCSKNQEAEKVCLQTILDTQENIDFNSVKLGVVIISEENKLKVAECFYTLEKSVELPNQTQNVTIVGRRVYDAKTCKRIGGKAISVDQI